MHRFVTACGLISCLVVTAAALVAVPTATSKAAMPAETTFFIPASDGYGVADCLSGKTGCGQVVANAWCESRGFGKAMAYGIAAPEDITASISSSPSLERPFSITCAD